jgi:O-antigen ligase
VILERLAHLAAAPQFSRALSMCAIGSLLFVNAIRSLIGWPGYFTVITGIVLLAALSLAVLWRQIEWRGLLPVSLLLFIGWCCLSLLWSGYQWSTVGGAVYLVVVAFLAVYVGLSRDLIQVIRAFGDVLRLALGASLALEIFSGVLIDAPIAFLGIQGNLASGGPIQGLFGSRNLLGLVALIALVTFLVELLTQSATRLVAWFSIAAATLTILFTRSPVTLGTLAALLLATLVLLALRRATPSLRRVAQFVLIGAVSVTLLLVFIFRSPLIAVLNAESEFETRYTLWKQVLTVIGLRPVEGVGWVGGWRRDVPPYVSFGGHSSALNAFLDVWLQVGIVGLALFIALLGLALVRSWLLGSNKPSVVYIWPVLVLITLVIVSAAESTVLSGIGWFTLVIVTLKASQELSWRRLLPEPPEVTAGR